MAIRRLLRRLGRCDRGYASMDFILAAPVMLFVLALVFDTGKYETAKQSALVLNRTAAWSAAEDNFCLYRKNLPNLIHAVTTTMPSVCRRDPYQAIAAGFWNELDNAGGEQLTGTTRRAESPDLISASMTTFYEFHPWPALGLRTIPDEYWVVRRQTWTHEDEAMKAGYDREVKARFRGVGSFLSLFPNVFPGGT